MPLGDEKAREPRGAPPASDAGPVLARAAAPQRVTVAAEALDEKRIQRAEDETLPFWTRE
jgi:hypothetical protein